MTVTSSTYFGLVDDKSF